MPRPKKRWADLSSRQRRVIVAGGVVQHSLLAATLIDLRRRPARLVSGDKRLWVAGSFISFVGPVAYFLFGRKR